MIYNFQFGSFSIRCHLGRVGHRPAYLSDVAHMTISNQKVVIYDVAAFFVLKSSALRQRGFEPASSQRA
jgi:hypothetical protein